MRGIFGGTILLVIIGCSQPTTTPTPAQEAMTPPIVARPAAGGAQNISPMQFMRDAPRQDLGARELQEFAETLERGLLSLGVSVTVLVDLEQDSERLPPTLMFFAHISKAFVYQLVTGGGLLERAKLLGFRTIFFLDKGGDGAYVFDLSRPGPPPRCARYNRVCA